MFFKRIVDLRNDKVEINVIPKTNEENISAKHDCIRFTDSYRFPSESLNKIVKNLDEDGLKIF